MRSIQTGKSSHTHAAQLVVEHFTSRGLNHFVFFSDTANWSYDERGLGFVAVLREAGHPCDWLKWHESPAFRGDRDQWRSLRFIWDHGHEPISVKDLVSIHAGRIAHFAGSPGDSAG
jgi:hypothetical protein